MGNKNEVAKNGKILILKTDDTFEFRDYEGYLSIRDAVGGSIDVLMSQDMPISKLDVGFEDIKLDFFCNDEFLIDDRFDKVNAIATFMRENENPVYGDVAVLISMPDGDNRGFGIKGKFGDEKGVITERRIIAEAMDNMIKTNKDYLADIHKDLDGLENKPKPTMELGTFDNLDEFFKS